MADKKDVVKRKTLEAKNIAAEKETNVKVKAGEIKEGVATKTAEIKESAANMTSDAKDKAIEVKKGAIEKTADTKDKALVKTSEIKESAVDKTAEIKEGATDKTAEIKEGAADMTSDFKENAEKTRKQAERKINEFISTLKDKQGELGKTLSDYASGEKLLADIIDTDDLLIIKADIPRVKKDDVAVHITEDTVEITANFEEEDEELNFIKKERSYGETKRIISLPVKIEVKKASANFNDSVLTVELPKVQEEKFKVDIN